MLISARFSHTYTPYTSEVYAWEHHALISKRLRYLHLNKSHFLCNTYYCFILVFLYKSTYVSVRIHIHWPRTCMKKMVYFLFHISYIYQIRYYFYFARICLVTVFISIDNRLNLLIDIILFNIFRQHSLYKKFLWYLHFLLNFFLPQKLLELKTLIFLVY